VFVLDTDHLTILQRNPGSTLAKRIAERGDEHFYISIVSFHEQTVGWHGYLTKATSARRAADIAHGYTMLQRILRDYSEMQVLSFTEADIQCFDPLRAQSVRIGTIDLRIAATALRHGFTLLSSNLSDFHKVPGLKVEDWAH
jgi:tRNA(fMet)-specific endonuclease VapC